MVYSMWCSVLDWLGMANKKRVSAARQRREQQERDYEALDQQFSDSVVQYVNELFRGEWRVLIEKIVDSYTIRDEEDWLRDQDTIACAVLSELCGVPFEIWALKKPVASKVLKSLHEQLGIDLQTLYGKVYLSPLHQFIGEFGNQLRAQINGEAKWELLERKRRESELR